MDGAHRLRLGGHPVAGQQRGRQRVGQLVRKGKRCVGAGRMAAGRQPLCAGIDRHEGAGRNLCFGAHQRMQQLTAGQRPADAPLKVVALPHREIVGRVGRIEPGQGQNTGIIRRQHAAHDAPAGDAAGRLLLQHGGAHAAVGVIGCGHNGVGLGVVDVFARVAQKQVADGMDAELFKLFGKGRADTLEVLDGIVDGGHRGTSFRGRLLCRGRCSSSARGASGTPPPTGQIIYQKRRTRFAPKFAFLCYSVRITLQRSCSSRPAGRR